MKDDPFGTLGLPARADLSDDEVRAAYDTLRTSFGRGEALADLGPAGTAPPAGRRGSRHARSTGARRLGVGGRARRIALRAAVAAGVTAAALLAVGWTPATVGLLTGALTWAAVTSRQDLPGRGDRLPGTSTRRANAFSVAGGRGGVSPVTPGTEVIRGTGRWRPDGPGR
jgi:hypothetical protein